MAVPKTTAVDSDITGGAYVAPTAPNKKAMLAHMVGKGVLTPAGAYAPGKGIADLDRLLQVRDPVTEIMAGIIGVVYGV